MGACTEECFGSGPAEEIFSIKMLRGWALRPNGHCSAASSPLLPIFASLLSITASAAFSPHTASVPSAAANRFAMSRRIRVVVVGDVHDDWDLEQDSRALHFLQADLVLLTGDYGDENVELVRSISNLKFPKAAILGNHDCWFTEFFTEMRNNRVHLQLECLGEEHVGYRRLDFPTLKLCVLGGRPFSCGGETLNGPNLLLSRYGVSNMEESAKKICEAADGIPEEHSVIILAHNGPTGLGSDASDICGKDWDFDGGDYGDPDLAQSISTLQAYARIRIPLVVFGHMHQTLSHGRGVRKMIVVSTDSPIYLNCAVVPRVKRLQGATPRSTSEDNNQFQISANGTLRAFTVVEMQDGQVEKIAETWVLVADDKVEIQEETVLFQKQ